MNEPITVASPRLLFCSANALDPTLGAAKVILEIASELEQAGWPCHLVSAADICPEIARYSGRQRLVMYSRALRAYLQQRGRDYDIVDYDHGCLPYPRRDFSATTLFVARSVLLIQHLDKIRLPRFRGAKSTISHWTRGPYRRWQQLRSVADGDTTCREADVVNVSNDDDRATLIERGIDPRKIVVIPFGLTERRLAQFEATPSAPDRVPTVAFVGTFDGRKGAREFPDIVQCVAGEVPAVRFALFGTKSHSAQDVLRHFPKRLHSVLEIQPRFDPDELPGLLARCAVGIFPSRMEGFGFGVLEMLAAGLPVVAYRAPGPPMMLTDELLTNAGDAHALARKVVALLKNESARLRLSHWARERARAFRWRTFAETTRTEYLARLTALRSRDVAANPLSRM